MLHRAGKRLETTLLLSRQGLQRPARLYSSPSTRRNAPASATAQVPQPDYPPFLAHNARKLEGQKASSVSKELESFLKRGVPHTIIPTPEPEHRTTKSDAHSFWYVDTPTQDLLAVMDACLHNLYDVPRAKGIFDRMREKIGNPALETRIYNAFLDAYVNMAATRTGEDKLFWVENAWDLYDNMESGREKVAPNASTFAIMFLAWHRFNPDSKDPVRTRAAYPPAHLLTSLLDRDIPIQYVISDRAFTSSEEAAEVIRSLSKTAVDLNLHRIVSELGQAEAIGSNSNDILDDVPEVKPVLIVKKKASDAAIGSEPVPSENLEENVEYEVPFNLDNLRRHLAEVTFARRVLPEDVVARQKLLEESVYEVAVERLKHESEIFDELGIGGTLKQPDLQRWMWEWHSKLKVRLEEEIRNISLAERKRGFEKRNGNVSLSPYLSLVKAERLSLITILEIMRLQGSGGVAEGMKTTRALIAVGRAVEMEYKAQMCRKNSIYFPSTPGKVTANYFSHMGYNHLLERRVAAAKYMQDGEAWTAMWSQPIRGKVGGILVECLMDVAEVTRSGNDKVTLEFITEVQPAFYHSYEHVRGQKLGVIRLNPVVSERLVKDGLRETLHPRHLPMLVKPKPWLNYEEGGYFYNKTSAMRFKDSVEQQSYLKHASELGNVELVYAGLDVLGSTPWKINSQIFHVVLQVWNSGERLGKVPPAVYDVEAPQPPENMDVRDKSVYQARMKAFNQAKANNHSDRCNVNYKIEIARAFLGDTIYQPHNVDFRGRAYPIPPHLNHIGDDLSRGLLMFAETKPLGVRGLRWLKIHLANLYGYDKASFDEREQWVMDRLDDIYDSATKPLEGRRWWGQADDPWQCLACCMELHAALESESPHDFLSSLPVHQDGTCNGLQHYAALGGDAQGAAQVNLSAGDRPSDVYSFVGRMSEEIIAKDVERGEKYAIMLKGKIARKIVKQTVMTTVYGVTFIGAREQIERQIKALTDIPAEECWGAAAYLAKVVLACIGDLFHGANAIQTWLNLCASLISKSIPEERIPEALEEYALKRKSTTTLPIDQLKKEQMTTVVWTTPLGLPIVQPYRKPRRKQVMTAIQTMFIEDPNCPAAVNTQKQASAFPPNFIHSLDATHMMLTALECRTQGLTFAAVHDSYWTHACSIDKMSEIIRDTFIALHSSDVLVKLHAEFLERYKGYKVPLSTLGSGTLLKNLHAAGSQIIATPEQAASLRGVSTLLKVSDTEDSTVVVADANLASDLEAEEVRQLLGGLEGERAPEEEQDDEEELSPRAKAARKRAADNARLSTELMGKFINLTDIFPPLPKKGSFKVENIKDSPYFFS